jgi:hypothetical protein
MNEREKQKWYEIELRKLQALEDVAETLEGLLLYLQKK